MNSLFDANFSVCGYAKSQGRTAVTFGPTDLVCCRTLQGHTGKVPFVLYFLLSFVMCNALFVLNFGPYIWLTLTSQEHHDSSLIITYVFLDR